MAEHLHSSSPHPRASQGSRRNAPPRLRESCEPCSAAKVRCSKDKPTCTRCAERDLPCVYFATRRSGRPPNKAVNGGGNSSRNPDGGRMSVSQASHASTSLEGLPGQSCFPIFPELDTTFNNPVPPAPTHQNSWVDSLSTSSSSSSLSLACDTLPEWSPREMDDFFASFITIPGKDRPSPLPEPMLPSDDVFSTLVSSPMDTSRQHSTSDCDCLTTALDLLGKSDAPPDFSSSSLRQGKTPTETLISENQSVANAVDNILQCSCAQDSQVLIILALVVSKVLGRYGRAARVGPSSQGGSPPQSPRSMPVMGMRRHRPSSMTMAHIHGEDSGRAAGQLVLGELHRALKLVNELAARLNARGSRSGSPEWMRRPGSAGPNGSSSLDPTSTVSFSPSMLDQLGSDLREQLKAVVATITGMLQGTA